jgi:hypothetical protein
LTKNLEVIVWNSWLKKLTRVNEEFTASGAEESDTLDINSELDVTFCRGM